MRLVTYHSDRGPRVAGVGEEGCVDLNDADPDVPSCVKALLALGSEGLKRATDALAAGRSFLTDPQLLPPIPNPEKIVCVGANYVDHALESGMEPPPEPVIFNKFPTTIRKHGDPIVLPGSSDQVDIEAELVVVVGVGGRRIPEQDALSHVAAYCCGNDVSARDWQKNKPAGQWLLGKSFDSFAPIGPNLLTADEIPDPGHLNIRSRLKGNVMQDSNTSFLIFPIPRLISYVSEVCTLSPGDLLFTGTPPGVGMARTPPVFLKPGDVVEVEIEKIGILRNPVVADEA
jgi:2-keto-4-pentenoate hydratase/2-oxohepta-3-ene-1,7-dioic acid hydratase in catechol pathway